MLQISTPMVDRFKFFASSVFLLFVFLFITWVSSGRLLLGQSSLSFLSESGRGLLAMLPLLPVVSILFIAPSWVLLNKTGGVSEPGEKLALSILISSVAGYLAFWAYFFHPSFGKVFSFVFFILSLCSVRSFLRTLKEAASLDLQFKKMIRVFFLVGLFFLAALNWVYLTTPLHDIAMKRFGGMPPDNVLPLYFMEKLFEGADPRNLLGVWLSSDRPPLQTGILLLFRPVLVPYLFTHHAYYEIFAMFLQLLWLPALYIFLSVLKKKKQFFVCTFLLTFTGFVFTNTIYTWPKMLAAALTLLGLSFLLAEPNKGTVDKFLWAVLAFILGFLSHGGMVFTAPLIFLLAVRHLRAYPLWRLPGLFLKSLLIVVAVYGPWVAYQKLYNPPGDFLLRMHLAGHSDPDPYVKPGQAIIEAYKTIGWEKVLENKKFNLLFFVGTPGTDISSLQYGTLTNLLQFLGLLNLLWPFVFISLWRRKERPFNLLWGGIIGSLLFWVLAMFGPQAGAFTSLHQGSYATPLLMFVLMILSMESQAWVKYLVPFQVGSFLYIWIAHAPQTSAIWHGGILNPWMGVVGLAAGISLYKTTCGRT